MRVESGTGLKSPPLQAAALVALFSLAVLSLVTVAQYHWPVLYIYFIAEDSFAEYTTAVAFLLSAVFFGVGARDASGLTRGILVLGALASFFIAGEEISWGQRILEVETPQAIADRNYQGETNFHNLGVFWRVGQFLHEAMAVGLLALVGLRVAQDRLVFSGGIGRTINLLPLPPLSCAPLFLVASYVLAAYPLVKSDEVGEMLMGLAILSWASSYLFERGRAGGSGVYPVATLVATMLAAGLLTLAFPMDQSWRLNDAAYVKYPGEGMYEQALEIFDYIYANPDLIMPETDANHARIRALADG